MYNSKFFPTFANEKYNYGTDIIQLADENKNWVNYKPFDPNKYYIFKSNEIDRSGGWIGYNNNNTSYQIGTDSIMLRCSSTSSYYEVVVGSTYNYDVSNYSTFNILYSTENNNVTSNSALAKAGLTSNRISSNNPNFANVINQTWIGSAGRSTLMSMDISTLISSYYIGFSYSAVLNYLYITEVYFSNDIF